MEFLVFQFVPIASCSFARYIWEECGSIFFKPPPINSYALIISPDKQHPLLSLGRQASYLIVGDLNHKPTFIFETKPKPYIGFGGAVGLDDL